MPYLGLLGRRDHAAGLDPGQVGHEQGEGLAGPALALAQALDGGGIGAIDEQLEATHPLQGQDPACG
jgi:hypothetical protein